MKLSTYKKISVLLGVMLVIFLPFYVFFQWVLPQMETNDINTAPGFVGVDNCKACHLPEYTDWVGSHHDLAMDHATDSTVLGNFSGVELISQGRKHRMYHEGEKFMVYTDGEDGQMQEFEVKYVFGFTPLQQYLVEFDRGRLQVLPLTWNTLDSSWYHMADSLYKDENMNHANWLHWTNQAQNWNSMCAECHSTNLQKNYDYQSDSYHTTYSEIDVSCEACHGPGSDHVEWANLPEYSREKFINYGLEVKTSGIDHVAYVDNCVRCHSRKMSLGDFDHSTASIYDHSLPELPGEPSWFVDGQILDEDYVYASFLQSRMYERGVKCNDCHNVHSGKLLFEGNRLCLQCHTADVYDSYSHYHHKRVGEPGKAVVSESGVVFDVGSGTECINCHMHGHYYMGVDYRRDHSFRIPRPDLSIKHGTPNACNQCHVGESNEWSEKYIRQWFGESRRYHYSEALVAAQQGAADGLDQLKNVIADDLYPTNIRSLALQSIGNYYPDSAGNIADNYLLHTLPAIRLSATRSMMMQNSENISRLLNQLNDETKAVRTEAVQRLMQINRDQIPVSYHLKLDKAIEEYRDVLYYNADFPTGKINLANFYLQQNNPQQAEELFLKALNQDSALTIVNLYLAYLYNRKGQNEQAEKYFKIYLDKEPADTEAMYAYGLLLSEMTRYDQSLKVLLQVRELVPMRPRVNYNLAMLYDFMGEALKAEHHLKAEIAVVDDLNSRMALLKFYLDRNDDQKALSLAKKILESYPEAYQVKQILEQI